MFKVRLETPALATELAAYLEERGFLVTRRGRAELELALLNPVSERYDRAKAQSVLRAYPGRSGRDPIVVLEVLGS